MVTAERAPLSLVPARSGSQGMSQERYGGALEGRMGQAYGEKAFRYLLEIERKRSARPGPPLLVLLVALKGAADSGPSRIGPTFAGKLFAGLSLGLRETDLVGWYREGRIAGAVLPQFATESRAEVSGLIRQRVVNAVRECLAPDACRIQIHVRQLRPTPKN